MTPEPSPELVEMSTIEGRTLSTTETNWFCTARADPAVAGLVVAVGVVVVDGDAEVVVPCAAGFELLEQAAITTVMHRATIRLANGLVFFFVTSLSFEWIDAVRTGESG